MRAAWITVGLIAGLGGLLWLTLAGQGATCEACVRFEGRAACRSASAANREEASRQAQAAACALVTGGVTSDLACLRKPPEHVQCE